MIPRRRATDQDLASYPLNVAVPYDVLWLAGSGVQTSCEGASLAGLRARLAHTVQKPAPVYPEPPDQICARGPDPRYRYSGGPTPPGGFAGRETKIPGSPLVVAP